MALEHPRRAVLCLLAAASFVNVACAQSSAGRKSDQTNRADSRSNPPAATAADAATTNTTAATTSADAQAAPANAAAANAASAGGAVLRDVPERIDPAAKYLFYLHGRIVETGGVRPRHERHGFYEYEQILQTFAARGFNVVSEPRPADTEHLPYARKVVGQIKRLLAAGVPARSVTVVGASKGGAIAVFVSTLLAERDANFVVLAGCGDGGPYRTNKVDLHGRVLSIYDTADEFIAANRGGVSCAKYYKQSTGLKQTGEIAVQLGVGHGLLYKPFKEWIEPTVNWANGK